MAIENICPHCGKLVPPTALPGICPECMLKAGLADTGDVGPGGTVVAKPPRQPPPAVEEIAPHFPQLEILECLGHGGMGAVYKARQPKLDRFVALKILSRNRHNGTTDVEFAERFQREARALARLNHPDIVAVYDFGEAGGFHYLLMEYVDGLTLRQLLQTRKLSPEEALGIVPKICGALQFAHERGIVHRDIKPENILLDKLGQVKIADFGIAKIVGQPAGAALTQERQVIGTPHYMAPEQVEKPATVDHRADIYSLGVVFYEMLTGELPLGKFAPPSKKVQVDVRLDEIVLHALEKEPALRYQHASQLKTDVETVAAQRGAVAGSETGSTVDDEQWASWEKRAPGWRIRCRKCGFTEHWGKYGIRLVAAGNKWVFGRCKNCGRFGWAVIERDGAQKDFSRAQRVWIVVVAVALGAGSVLTAVINHNARRPRQATQGSHPPESVDERAHRPVAGRTAAAPVPPVVLSTVPQSGASDVDPALTEIRVAFSKPMQDGSWSWVKWSEESFPELTGKPKYLDDQATCTLPVRLQPGKVYAIWLNFEFAQNFKDREDHAAVPYLLIFQTRQK